METMHTFLLVFQAVVSVVLIGFILIQHGKGADAGAAFGSGASSTVFGSRGSGNFLTRTTTVLAIIFLSNSLLLGYLASHNIKQQGSLLDDEPAVILDQVQDTQQDTMDSQTIQVPADLPQGVTEAPASDIPVIPEE
jgi:preprotein translocase subunit SecG